MSSDLKYFQRADLSQNEPKQGEFSEISSIQTSNSKEEYSHSLHSKKGTKLRSII